MKALEAENYRLTPAVSDLTLDKMIKTDAACGHGAPHQLLNQLTTLVRYGGRVEIFNFGYKFGVVCFSLADLIQRAEIFSSLSMAVRP